MYLKLLQLNQSDDLNHLWMKVKFQSQLLIISLLLMIFLGSRMQKSSETFDEVLKLKGQMLYVKEWDAIIFLATPV